MLLVSALMLREAGGRHLGWGGGGQGCNKVSSLILSNLKNYIGNFLE